MPTPDPDFISQDTRILNRLRPFIDTHVDAQPEATRELLRRHLDEHGGLQYAVERLGPEDRWHVVVGVAGERLCGVDARLRQRRPPHPQPPVRASQRSTAR